MKELPKMRSLPRCPCYGITRDGEVWRLEKPRRGRVAPYKLKPHAGKRGYLTVAINGRTTPIQILVAETYVPNPDNKPEVAHCDGNGHNNQDTNLRWATRKENNDDRFEHGTMLRGEQITVSRLTEKDIPVIRNRLKKGVLQRVIAEDYGVSRRCIGKVKTGASWSHV